MIKTNLENYLDFYSTLKNPGYAVLVTGEWGSGKTYQVLKAIPPDIQCHVSLFGLSKSEEVYSTVFAKMYPGKNFAKKVLEMTKDISSEVAGLTLGAGTIAGGLLSPLIKQTVDKEKIIIFDDLERCSIPNDDILGVINQYVEHHQCRVIILAHDKKTHSDFIESKEKIIGHSIKIKPQLDEAATFFFQEHHNLNNFNYIKPIILNAFKRTDCKSLRVLKSLISDCSRLLNCLEPIYIKNKVAMKEVFTTFCLIDIEYRLGNLSAEDIPNIPITYVKFLTLVKENEKATEEVKLKNEKLIKFLNKYFLESLKRRTLGNDVLSSIFTEGNYPKDDILNDLKQSMYFYDQIKHPAWLTIYNFDNLESKDVRIAIDEMFNDLKNLKIVDIEDILHSFYASYILSNFKEIDLTFYDLYKLQIEYIDKLLENDLLLPEPLQYDHYGDSVYARPRKGSYWKNEAYQDYIDMVIEHIKLSRTKSKERRRTDYITDILSALESDYDRFRLLLVGDGEQAGLYSNIDILKDILPQDFLAHWFMQPIDKLDLITSILIKRYSNAKNSILINEKLWLSELCITIMFEAKNYQGIDRARIERLVPLGTSSMF
ncbi:hypothetical protein [Pantoea agglomerans]|uniref:hypothetical protein n=1 Tax=Enterobacter agglomerans TaxID=549 RepID=UPI0038251BAC